MDMQRKKITIFIILLFAVIAVTALTSAKYLYNSVWNYYVKSKGFYFTSDSLDINTKKMPY